jgi:hypothetical protein
MKDKLVLNKFVLNDDPKKEAVIDSIINNVHFYLVEQIGFKSDRKSNGRNSHMENLIMITGSVVLKNFFPDFRDLPGDIDVLINAEPNFSEFYKNLQFILLEINKEFQVSLTVVQHKNRFAIIDEKEQKWIDFICAPRLYEQNDMYLNLFQNEKIFHSHQIVVELISKSIVKNQLYVSEIGIHKPIYILFTKLMYLIGSLNKISEIKANIIRIKQNKLDIKTESFLLKDIISNLYKNNYYNTNTSYTPGKEEEYIKLLENSSRKHKDDIIALIEYCSIDFNYLEDPKNIFKIVTEPKTLKGPWDNDNEDFGIDIEEPDGEEHELDVQENNQEF